MPQNSASKKMPKPPLSDPSNSNPKRSIDKPVSDSASKSRKKTAEEELGFGKADAGEIGSSNHGIDAHHHNVDGHLSPKSNEVELEQFGVDGQDYSSFFETSDQFDTVDALHAWANDKAKTLGFRLVRATYKTSSVPGRLSVYLRCWRYGKSRGKVTDLDKAARSKTKTKACQCPFVIVAKTLSPDHSWYVQVFSGDKGTHNHNLNLYDEGQQHGRLSDEMKAQVRDMTATGCTPAAIHTSLKQKFPNFNSNIVQIYNERSRLKIEEANGKTHVQHGLQLAKEHGYTSRTDMDDDGHVSQDFAYFESLVNEVRQSDPAIIRYVSHVLEESLHPKNNYIPEPNASPQHRGRPNIGWTTRREHSVFDYSHGRGRRGRSSSSSTTGRGSRGSNSVDLSVEGPNAMSATAFPWPNAVPTLILPYITGWFDVVGDGNCGFRIIAEVGFGGQGEWVRARRTLCTEIGANLMQYHLVYELRTGLTEALDRIGRHMYGAAPLRHWMETPYDLYAAATYLNCIFVNFALGTDAAGATVDQSGTVFPLRAFPGATGPERIIGIAFVNNNHYVQVHLHDDCPLPRPYVNWKDVRHNSVDGWDEPYAHRFAMWDNLNNVYKNNDEFQVFDLGDNDN